MPGEEHTKMFGRDSTTCEDLNRDFKTVLIVKDLWVEVEVEKELGIRNKKDIENLVSGDKKASIAKFVELCQAKG